MTGTPAKKNSASDKSRRRTEQCREKKIAHGNVDNFTGTGTASDTHKGTLVIITKRDKKNTAGMRNTPGENGRMYRNYIPEEKFIGT